jgi:tetratricopeptide (TPR) repeat protein
MRPTSFRCLLLLVCISAAAPAAHAEDSFNFDGLTYSTTINGLRDGKLSAMVGGSEKLYDLDKVQQITLGASARFNDAEMARADNAKKAAAFYREAIRGLNSVPLKQLAEYRAIEPTDADGRWVDAINYFLDLYQSAPIDSIWKIRPTHMPAPSSSMLRESADRIAAAIRSARSDEAKKNLKTFQMDIYTQMGDTESAQRLAKEIATGIVEDPSARAKEPDAAALANAALGQVDALLRDKKYDAAIEKTDALLSSSTADVCVQLFLLKARAYEEKGNTELAVATLLRIPAHYPTSGAVPAALLHAAELEKRANHADEAKALFDEIVQAHPDAKEAVTAKAQ